MKIPPAPLFQRGIYSFPPLPKGGWGDFMHRCARQGIEVSVICRRFREKKKWDIYAQRMHGNESRARHGPLGRLGSNRRGRTTLPCIPATPRSVTLLLYAEHDPVKPVHSYVFDPILNKTGLIWHCLVPEEELRGATLYAYRVDGPNDPSRGHRFDAQKVLLDPFAFSVYFPPEFSRSSASNPGPTDGMAPLGRLSKDPQSFAWDADPRPRHTHDLIVYELHVKGFTARSNSGVGPEKRGYLCRAHREDSLSQGSRNYGGGTPSRSSVRSSGGQLLGLHDPQFLFAPSWLRLRRTRTRSFARW